jgi:virginiamycin B lyase
MVMRVILGIIMALSGVVIISVIAFLLLSSTLPFANQAQPKVVRQQPYDVQRSVEMPFSSHRALSEEESQEATAVIPWGIAVDYTRGFVWVAEPGCDAKPACPATTQGVLGQYAYSDSNLIQNVNEPVGYSSPLFVAVDKNGDVWFTQPGTDAIGEFDPQSQNWNQWLLAKGSKPYDLIFDSSGNLWFTEYGSNKIGFFNPRADRLVENATPIPQSNPYGLTIDPAGTIWFTQNALGVDQIGSFTPTSSGVVKIAEHDAGAIRPHLIASDRQGNIWYSGGFGGDIGEFNPRSGSSRLFVVYQGFCASPPNCTGTHISGIDVDNRGDIWFTDSLSQRVGYLVPSTGQVVARTIDGSSVHPHDGLLVDKSGRIWFTEEFGLTLNLWPASSVK